MFSVFLGLAAFALYANAAKAARTEVVFDHPENFTDAQDGGFATDKGRDYILSQLRGFLVDRADRLLPAGYSLKMTFTDVDLAGEFEPWRGPQWYDVRIIKDIYPPSFKFTYVVTGPSGAVVKQGKADIRDLDFQMRLADPTNDDPLRYEKDMLGDWVSANLRKLK
jgi:hypothetical protein